MSRTLPLAQELMARASVTPDDAGCLEIISRRLADAGFTCERLDRGTGASRVANLWAMRRGTSTPRRTVVLAGHTDVVPPGPEDAWTSPPFSPTLRGDQLVGRGACDMKASLAAMVVAAEDFLSARPDPRLSIAFLLTSDEEGDAVDGTVHVCDVLAARDERLDWCVVGEPTSVERLGDVVKNGRRGSLSGRLTVKGVQGHIAYPHLARNPIHQLAPALAELAAISWDAGNAYFPPTTWQASNIRAGTGAGNVIPGRCVLDFNFRFSTESSPDALQARVGRVLDAHGLEYQLDWTLGGAPFLTQAGDLTDVARHAITAEVGIEPKLSTSGGTSDGRFLARLCQQVLEVGPVGRTAHRVDESVAVADLVPLTGIYRRILEGLDDRCA